MITITLPNGIKISGNDKDEVLEVYDHLERSFTPRVLTPSLPSEYPFPKMPSERIMIYGKE